MTKIVKFTGNLCHFYGHKHPKTKVVLAVVFVPAKCLIPGRAECGDKNDQLFHTVFSRSNLQPRQPRATHLRARPKDIANISHRQGDDALRADCLIDIVEPAVMAIMFCLLMTSELGRAVEGCAQRVALGFDIHTSENV